MNVACFSWCRQTLLKAYATVVGLLLVAMACAATAQPLADFFRAAALDDVATVRSSMLRGVSANARDSAGTPALVVAAREQSWRVVRALAELKGTDLDATNEQGASALMYAALHGELPTVRFLVGRGAQVNRSGWTALHFAAANGQVEVVKYLLEESAYIDAESPNGTTPLMMAVRQGQPTVAQLLVAEGADPTPRNQSGRTAADYARGNGETELAAWLTRQAAEFTRRYRTPAPR